MTEIPPNPHLDEFLQNTLAVKREVEQDSELMEEIRESLSQWVIACRYKRLVPNRYGIKGRSTFAQIEVAVNADLYRPDLHISPFCLILEDRFNAAYLTKDFSGESCNLCDAEAGRNEEEALAFPPISDAVDYMISRGYGTHKNDDEHTLDDPETIKILRKSRINYFMNLFLFDPETKEWAMHDLECNSLRTFEEIVEGADNRGGRFSRLHDIWKVLSSDRYRLDLNGEEK